MRILEDIKFINLKGHSLYLLSPPQRREDEMEFDSSASQNCSPDGL